VVLKILLADDSMIAQNMGRKILTDAGYDVVPVSNGAAAVKRLPDVKPDIVLLDVYMPGYTGLEVCEKIKNAPDTAHVPVLLTVGKLEPFRPEDGMKVKADGVIVKPFEATDLVAVVAKLAERIPVGAREPVVGAEEILSAVQSGQGLEVVAPPPVPVAVPEVVATAPAAAVPAAPVPTAPAPEEDFLSEVAVAAPAAGVAETPAAPVTESSTGSSDLSIEIDFLMDTSADSTPVSVAPEAVVVTPEAETIPEAPAPVPPAEIQAAVAGFDLLTPEAPASQPAVAPPAEPSAPPSAEPASVTPPVAVEFPPELPPLEIFLETVETEAEEAAQVEFMEPTPPREPVPSLPGLEPTALEVPHETEFAAAPGLMSDYHESPVKALSETVTAPADTPTEEPPGFALFNSVLAADAEVQVDQPVAATLETSGAAAKIAEPPPAPPVIAAEPEPEFAETATQARVTDAQIPDQSAAESSMATHDAIGQALEAMLAGSSQAAEMEEDLSQMEALEQAVEIFSQSPVREPEELPAPVEAPVEFAPEPEEPPLEFTVEAIAESVAPEEPSAAPAEAVMTSVEMPVTPAAPVLASEESPVAAAAAEPVVIAAPPVDENVAEQIVDQVLQRIRSGLVEEVKRLLERP
jgi:CheY-like chemotaxis protein